MIEKSSLVHAGGDLKNQNTESRPDSSKMVWKTRRANKNRKKPSRSDTSSLNNVNRRKLKSCLKPSAGLLAGSVSDATSSTTKDFSLTSGYVKYIESQSSTSTNNSKRSRELSCPSGCSSGMSRSDSTSRHSGPQSASSSRNSGSRSSRSRHSDPSSTTSDIRVAENGHRSHIPQQKSVRFKEIRMREYVRVIGDNPSCSNGPPISIGWAHGETNVINISNYEVERKRNRHPRQARVLSREEREILLQLWDVPHHDIIQATRNNVKAKFQRRQTVRNIKRVEKLEIVFEGAAKALKRALYLRRRTLDEVEELQFQADLAARSLEEAQLEDLIYGGNHDGQDDTISISEPEGDYDWNNMKVEVSGHCKSYPIESMVYADGADEVSDDAASTFSGNTRSTSTSVKEMERFYKELELEMFGGEEPPLLGRTLEVPEFSKADGDTEALTQDDNLSLSSSLPSYYPEDRRSNGSSHRNQHHHHQRLPYSSNSYFSDIPVSPIHLMQYNGSSFPQTSSYRGYSLRDAYGGRSSPYYIPPQQNTMGLGQQRRSDTYNQASQQVGSETSPFWRQSSEQEKLPQNHNDEPSIKHLPLPTRKCSTKWMEENDSPKARQPHEPVTISETHDQEQQEPR